MSAKGVDRFELVGLGAETFRTVGRATRGQAFPA